MKPREIEELTKEVKLAATGLLIATPDPVLPEMLDYSAR